MRKDGKKIAVQVKRYDQGNLVGVKDLNQVLGAMKYYSCETSMVITTTEFTTPAKELARTTNVELWGWEKLYENIKKVYFNGSDIYEYFQKTEAQKGVNDNKIELEVEKVLEKGKRGRRPLLITKLQTEVIHYETHIFGLRM